MRDKNKLKPRKVIPDPVYGSKLITKLINRLMKDGKKQIAVKFLYKAIGNLKEFIHEEYSKYQESDGSQLSLANANAQLMKKKENDIDENKHAVPEASQKTVSSNELESYKVIWFFENIIKKIAPGIEIISKRVGGANYSIPVPISANRALSLAMNWLITSIRNRKEHSLDLKISYEFTDIILGRGETLKKKDQTNKVAESNRAFSHYANAK